MRAASTPTRPRPGLATTGRRTVTGSDGVAKPRVKRGYLTRQAGFAGLRDALAASAKGGFTEPSKQVTGEYLAAWLDGLRLAPSTVASYRKNVRLHIAPNVGSVPLASLTPVVLDRLYVQLERDGRADHKAGQGLSPRTVRYVHTILSSALRDAVESGLLPANPASRAHPPTAKQAASPEMHPWSAAELAAFLAWARENSELAAAWHVLSFSGMRRGELLGLRWRDVDLDAATITVRRSAGLVRTKGEGAAITEGPTKTGKPRVVDLDPGTVAVLKTWKRERGTLALALAKDEALVFGDLNNHHRQPEHFSRTWNQTVARAIRDGVEIPEVRLHDLRHSHATILLQAGEPVHVVSQRLGHASVVITLGVYSHVMPGDQRRAASRFAELVEVA